LNASMVPPTVSRAHQPHGLAAGYSSDNQENVDFRPYIFAAIVRSRPATSGRFLIIRTPR